MTTITRHRAPCRLTIDNIRGTTHESLLLTPGTVTDIRRPNAGGKTTLAAAVAACFAREPDPLGFGATPKDRARYLHRDAVASEHPCTARIACEDEQWEIVWHPLLARVEINGDAPRISTLAAWFARDWTHGTHEERARRWHQALALTPPTAADVERTLRDDCALPEGDIAPIANVIANALPDRHDVACDYAHHLALEQQKQAQRRWMDIVRDAGDPKSRFGARIAKRWTPPYWTEELADIDPADLERSAARTQAEIDAVRRELAALQAACTATAQRKEQMRDIASRIETLRARQNELSSAEAAALTAINDDTTAHRHADALERERAAHDAFERAKTNAETAAAALEDHDRRHAHTAETLARATRVHAELLEADTACEQAHLERRTALENNIADAAPCPTCHRPWPDAAETARSRIDALERTRADERAHAKERIADAERALHDARAAARVIDEEPSSRDFTTAARDAVRRRHDTERAYLEAAEAARAAAAYAPGCAAAALENARHEHAVIEGQIKTLDEHREALAATPDAARDDDTATLTARIATLQRRLDVEQRQCDAARIKHDADSAAANADAWAKAVRTLSAEHGIRRERTHEAVACAMRWLERINTITGDFGAATIEHDTLRWNGLPVEMASNGERWCAYTWLRLALSNRLGEYLHVADGADTLMPSWRARAREAVGRIAATTGIIVLWTEATDPPP